MYEDNFNIYKAFTTAEEQLFLSYASSNSEGKTLRSSILISKIKKIFPKIITESDIVNRKQEIINKQATFEELLENIRRLKDGEEIEEKWYSIYNYFNLQNEWQEKLKLAMNAIEYNNQTEKVSKENILKLYGNNLRTSISKLEQYKRCPFSYYLKYGLKVSEKSKFKIQTLDTGTFMHEIIDEFFKIIAEEKINVREIEEEKLKNIVSEIIEDKLKLDKNYIFTSTEKYKILSMRLKKVIEKSMKYIIESLKQSKFDIIETELEFNDKTKNKPMKFKLEDGRTVEVIGKIDRVDLYKSKNERYVRIIDYKSSIKNIDLNEVSFGVQIQLLTYLNEVTKLENADASGVLYFNLIDPIIKANKNLSNEEIENEIRKKFKMQGLILADINVIKLMDTSLEKGASAIIPAYIDSKGNLSNMRSSTVTKEQFEILQKYMNKIIKQISKEILDGNIDIKPTYNVKKKKTPCEYCEYKAICQFDSKYNNYNYISNLEKELVLQKMKEE